MQLFQVHLRETLSLEAENYHLLAMWVDHHRTFVELIKARRWNESHNCLDFDLIQIVKVLASLKQHSLDLVAT